MNGSSLGNTGNGDFGSLLRTHKEVFRFMVFYFQFFGDSFKFISSKLIEYNDKKNTNNMMTL
jgi:hypothetical protein